MGVTENLSITDGSFPEKTEKNPSLKIKSWKTPEKKIPMFRRYTNFVFAKHKVDLSRIEFSLAF